MRITRRSVALEANMPSRIVDELEAQWIDLALPPGPKLREHLGAGRTLVLLAGAPGSGKTLSACLALVDRGIGAFVSAPWYAEMHASFRTQLLAERAAERTMLVIDDLGEESERDAPALAQLLTHRYDLAGRCTTIVTSNLRPKEIGPRYGKRIISRLEDPRHSAVIACRAVLRPRRGADG